MGGVHNPRTSKLRKHARHGFYLYAAYDAHSKFPLSCPLLIAIAGTARRAVLVFVIVIMEHIVAGSDGKLGLLQRVAQRGIARIDELEGS